jgi:hypothetical protein
MQNPQLPCSTAPVLSGVQGQVFVTVRQLRFCRCVAPSLTRGRVCRLQLLLALASALILESESRGTYDRILQSQIRDSPNLEGRIYIPRNRWPSDTLRHWVVSRSNLFYDWRFTANQFVLAPSLLRSSSFSLYILGADPIENTVSKSSSLVVYLLRRKPTVTCCLPAVA